MSIPTPATPTPDATTPGRVELPWETVRKIADDRHVLSVYAAPEFEELSDDGRAWIKAVVEVAFVAGSAALTPSPSAGMEEIGQLIREHERSVRENESGFLDDVTLTARRKELTATLASLRAEREVPAIGIPAKLRPVLETLWRYGEIYDVKGVVYPAGSHRECLDKLSAFLWSDQNRKG